jgi:hypothetical protein
MPQFENMTAEHYQVDTDLPISNFSHCHIGILNHLDRLTELLHVMGLGSVTLTAQAWSLQLCARSPPVVTLRAW